MPQALREVWEQVPPVACKGLCTHSCSAITMAPAEVAAFDAAGIEIGFDFSTARCDQLRDGRCAIYDDRPLVCRLWGAVPEMPCEHGCEPTLTTEQANELRRLLFALEEA